MTTLYIAEQGTYVRKTSDRLRVTRRDEVLAEVPCLHLERVAVFGNVQFSTQSLVELLDHGISLSLFTRRGRYRGRLVAPLSGGAELRLRQAEVARTPELSGEFSAAIVRAKILNTAALLSRYRRNHPAAITARAVDAIESAARDLNGAMSLDALRGVEGSAAAKAFACYGAMFREPFRFEGRSRRPPTDPVNALLSFGYMLLVAELEGLIEGHGLDPYVGFFHQLRHGRSSLALDVLEGLRAPLVDRAVSSACNLTVVTPEDFEGDAAQGVRLRKDGLKRFLAHFESTMTTEVAHDDGARTPRQTMRAQVERLARWLRDGTPYEPYRFPC
ncbi:MAG: CRISPR-associated endonuclease Cas1 [Gemmatimonadetes bacterium]|nr:CRISPR-associated endonuclease Cas1 [Gemmatimonadota bacterium]